MGEGVPRDEAVARARASFGSHPALEWGRRKGGPNWLETIGRDLRISARRLMASRGSTAVILLSLMVGIGVSTSIFSLADLPRSTLLEATIRNEPGSDKPARILKGWLDFPGRPVLPAAIAAKVNHDAGRGGAARQGGPLRSPAATSGSASSRTQHRRRADGALQLIEPSRPRLFKPFHEHRQVGAISYGLAGPDALSLLASRFQASAVGSSA